MGDVTEQLADSGRETNGRFAKGHRGIGGRPKGYDLRRIAEEYGLAEDGDEPSEQTVARILQKAAALALDGDMGAAKLLLDKIGIKDADVVQLQDERTDMPDEEFARKVVSLLATLQARKAAVRN
jgi:hypothetical protein